MPITIDVRASLPFIPKTPHHKTNSAIMLHISKIFAVLTLVFVFASAESPVNYDNYKLLRISPQTETHFKAFQALKDIGINVGSSIPQLGRFASLLVPPNQIDSALELCAKYGNDYFDVTVSDVGKLIRSQKVSTQTHNGKLYWDEYYNLDAIYEYLDAQAAAHPTLATVQNIGTTYENRNLTIIKITNSNETKKAIWIDSNIHAREWITGAVGTYIIDQLLNGTLQTYLDDFDFYVLPIANPDGFDYTHKTDRYWRKTRSNSSSPQGCKGADPNRNFDAFWMENGGASDDPCSTVYAGESIFSEPETKAMADFLTTISSRLVFYLSLHSAGQYILIPTGLNSTHIPQYDEYMRIGNNAAEAHAMPYGTNFTAGSVFDIMYPATGSSMDWAYLNIPTAKLHITYELRDKGTYGHLLPPDQILPSCEEFIEGLKVYLDELKL